MTTVIGVDWLSLDWQLIGQQIVSDLMQIFDIFK